MGTLIIPKSIWEKTRAHLFQNDEEHFAFFLAGISDCQGDISFLVKNVILIQDDELNFSQTSHSMLKLDALLRVTNAARSKGLAVIEAHSHTFVKNNVIFSSTDERELKGFAKYMLEDLSLPYGATVWGTESVEGRYWCCDGTSKPIIEIRVIGKNLIRMITTSGKKLKDSRIQENHSKYDRQVQSIGKEGQRKINNTKVVIGGAGGIASHVIQQLAYLGVKDFTIIDFDKVELTNLNRLVGATNNDIGMPKTQIMKRLIHFIAGKKGITVNVIDVNLRDIKALYALKQADVIFGCVDNDGARLILNEAALAYLIPLIDCGVGIDGKDGKINEAGGRVVVVHPDGPCLLCAKEIDFLEASNDLAPIEELEIRRNMGYVDGEIVKNPSVISLNGTIASLAVTEFLALVTGVREVKEYTIYDMVEQKMVQRIIKSNPKCFPCSQRGVGDKIDLRRYSFTSIPTDIPSIPKGNFKDHIIAAQLKLKEVIK